MKNAIVLCLVLVLTGLLGCEGTEQSSSTKEPIAPVTAHADMGFFVAPANNLGYFTGMMRSLVVSLGISPVEGMDDFSSDCGYATNPPTPVCVEGVNPWVSLVDVVDGPIYRTVEKGVSTISDPETGIDYEYQGEIRYYEIIVTKSIVGQPKYENYTVVETPGYCPAREVLARTPDGSEVALYGTVGEHGNTCLYADENGDVWLELEGLGFEAGLKKGHQYYFFGADAPAEGKDDMLSRYLHKLGFDTAGVTVTSAERLVHEVTEEMVDIGNLSERWPLVSSDGLGAEVCPEDGACVATEGGLKATRVGVDYYYRLIAQEIVGRFVSDNAISTNGLEQVIAPPSAHH